VSKVYKYTSLLPSVRLFHPSTTSLFNQSTTQTTNLQASCLELLSLTLPASPRVSFTSPSFSTTISNTASVPSGIQQNAPKEVENALPNAVSILRSISQILPCPNTNIRPTTPVPRASLTPLDLPRFLRPSKTLLPRVLRRLFLSQFILQTSREFDNATVMYFTKTE
jgi:hypothetical protein